MGRRMSKDEEKVVSSDALNKAVTAAIEKLKELKEDIRRNTNPTKEEMLEDLEDQELKDAPIDWVAKVWEIKMGRIHDMNKPKTPRIAMI